MTKTWIAAAAVALTALASPLAAQDYGTGEQRVIVIDPDDGASAPRETRVVRVVEREKTAADVDAVEKVQVRVLRMGEDAEISEDELRAITDREIADGNMVVLSGREMKCEKASGREVRLKVCTTEGAAAALKALKKARIEIAKDETLSGNQRARAIMALDRRIAELEAAPD